MGSGTLTHEVSWISVEEETPDDYIEVLVTDGELVFIGYCVGGTWYQDHDVCEVVVSHWMEYPEPPEV